MLNLSTHPRTRNPHRPPDQPRQQLRQVRRLPTLSRPQRRFLHQEPCQIRRSSPDLQSLQPLRIARKSHRRRLGPRRPSRHRSQRPLRIRSAQHELTRQGHPPSFLLVDQLATPASSRTRNTNPGPGKSSISSATRHPKPTLVPPASARSQPRPLQSRRPHLRTHLLRTRPSLPGNRSLPPPPRATQISQFQPGIRPIRRVPISTVFQHVFYTKPPPPIPRQPETNTVSPSMQHVILNDAHRPRPRKRPFSAFFSQHRIPV